ncbi:MAG: flagellar assembly protein FliX [Rickettsiales bacterium]|nr:flagellar assembly protein FliX [Rickettsiales bacterium]
MKITPFFPILPSTTTQRTRRSSQASGASFSDYMSETEEASGAQETPPPVAASAINYMLALQEVSDEDVSRQKSFKAASLTLDVLEELRNALLIGELPTHLLNRLSQRISEQKALIADPRLLSVMKDIELRAAVELAKLEQRK